MGVLVSRIREPLLQKGNNIQLVESSTWFDAQFLLLRLHMQNAMRSTILELLVRFSVCHRLPYFAKSVVRSYVVPVMQTPDEGTSDISP